MKNSKKFERTMILLGLVLIISLIVVMKFFEEQIALMLLLVAAGLVYMVIYAIDYVIKNVCKVVKYRKDPWPQEHKFLWFLTGFGFAQIILITWPIVFIYSFNAATIILIIVSSFAVSISKGKLREVEEDREKRDKENEQGLQKNEETHIWVSFRLLFNSRIYYFRF